MVNLLHVVLLLPYGTHPEHLPHMMALHVLNKGTEWAPSSSHCSSTPYTKDDG